jgi:hypothetical protein
MNFLLLSSTYSNFLKTFSRIVNSMLCELSSLFVEQREFLCGLESRQRMSDDNAELDFDYV